MENNEKNMLVDVYIFENNKLLEELEDCLLNSEQDGFNRDDMDKIFRIMHTIKGSSNIMGYNNIGKLAHIIEDLLDFLRENTSLKYDKKELYDLLLNGMDGLTNETSKLKDKDYKPVDFTRLIKEFKDHLNKIKTSLGNYDKANSDNELEENLLGNKYIQVEFDESVSLHTYYARVHFVEDCDTQHLRAFELVFNIKNILKIKEHIPFRFDKKNEGLLKKKGFQIIFQSELNKNEVNNLIIEKCFYLRELELYEVKDTDLSKNESENAVKQDRKIEIIGVNVDKLDKLMDMTSEIIITEAILVQNPDLNGLKLRNFKKVARQFNKITNELQDIVMSIRMVSLTTTFNKMKRLTRDIAQKLNKKVKLEIKGEKTEVDKNIIENITDPLIHIIRNSVDHGIEIPNERLEKGKPDYGVINLEAKNVGSEVWITVEDDGRGLDYEKIKNRAMQMGIINDIKDMNKNEIYSMIFKPGFSTKEEANEYSGRGVGMDIVVKNIEKIFGTIDVDSKPGKGSIFTIRIPLTLAIIRGITFCVGDSKFTAPVESIEEVLILKEENIIKHPEKGQIIKIRDKFYDIVKLGEKFKIKSNYDKLIEGTTLLVNTRSNKVCIFVDKLLGEQQVVVKPLPKYTNNIGGFTGCTLLGDGTISLILDLDTIAK